MKKKNKNSNELNLAFEIISKLHPEVYKVKFDKYLQWKYMDKNNKPLIFSDEILARDEFQYILENACDSIEIYPGIYYK